MAEIMKKELAIVCLCVALAQFSDSTPAQAAKPVEFVKVCTLFGTGFFFIPGTDTCVDADEINRTQAALSAFTSTAFQGIAVSTAIVTPFVPNNANYAVSVHWGGFQGNSAIGVAGVARLGNSNLFLSAGVGSGLNGGTPTGQRAGFMFAW